MASLRDVENTLVAALAGIIYPDGTSNPSVTGSNVRISRGWPLPENLNADLAAGNINVTVFAQDNERNVTRYPREWQVASPPVVGLTLTASGSSITVAGTPSSPLNAAVDVNGKTYAYAVQPGDTTTTIATALAQLINFDTQTASSGPVISIPGGYRLASRVGGFGATIRELKRQKRGFIITCWCPDPDSRDDIATAIDDALAGVDYLSLPDGTAARLIYEKTVVTDRSEKANLYRRDLFYSVEYATTQAQQAAQIVATVLNLADFAGNALPDQGDCLLLEEGSYMRMEDGQILLISSDDALQAEDGSYPLTEDGDILLIDEGTGPLPLLLTEGGLYLTKDGGGPILVDGGAPSLLSEAGESLLAEDGNGLDAQ